MNSTALMSRATIHEIVAMRGESLRLFREGYDTLRRAREVAKRAAPQSFLPTYPDRVMRLLESCGADYSDEFEAAMTKVVDQAVWAHLISMTGMERLMDAKAREEFRHDLCTNPPEVTVDNCYATVEGLIADADTIFKRGIANAFSKLDRRFRSHDGFKIGSRIIFEMALTEYGSWSGRRCDEHIRDVERAFHLLDGKEQPERYAGIIGAIDSKRINSSERVFTAESEYFRVRAFANGNLHVYFQRDDLVKKVNLLLADYYGAALGVSPDAAPRKHKPKTGLAKNFGFFPTPDDLAESLVADACLKPDMTFLEPSAGTGVFSRRALDAGCSVTCVEVQPHLAAELEQDNRYTAVLAMDFLELDPSLTGQFDRIIMNPPFDCGRDVDHVNHAIDFLAPGGTMIAIMSAGVEFRTDAKTKDFRDRVECLRGRFYDLPPGSFAASGTMVNTVVMTLTKH